MANCYGLDYKYFEKKLKSIIEECSNYTPGEMYIDLVKCAMVAKSQDNKSEPIPLINKLLSAASQENCDSIEHDLMIEAVDEVRRLREQLANKQY